MSKSDWKHLYVCLGPNNRRLLITKQNLQKHFSSTYIAKVFIQQLHISVQHFEAQQLIILVIHTGTEIQAGIPAFEEENGQMSQQWLTQCCQEFEEKYKVNVAPSLIWLS